jgi:hypothetical protein
MRLALSTAPHLRKRPAAEIVSIVPRVSRGKKVLLQISLWIDTHPERALGLLAAFYFLMVFSLSAFKLLWLDEFITLNLARLGSASALWAALGRGADPNPPLIHLAVMLCRHLFGEHEWALRLPAMLGYCVGFVSLFFFLLRRVPGTWALAGAILSMSMGAFNYAFESRSYGVFYGWTMLAVLCWSRTVDEQTTPARRHLALCGMIFALAAGISTNYFAILAFAPVAGGEAVRTWKKLQGQKIDASSLWRVIDPRIWLGILVAVLPMLAYRPLVAKSISVFSSHAWNKVSWVQAEDSYFQMVALVFYPILAIFVLAITVELTARMCNSCRADLPKWLGKLATQRRQSLQRKLMPAHEVAATWLLILYPVLGYAMASVRGGMLSPRFVIPVCFGFAIAPTMLLYRMFRNVRVAGTCFLLLATVWMVGRACYIGDLYSLQKEGFYRMVSRLPAVVPPEGSIAVPDPLLVLPLQRYAPAAISSRIVYPVDFPSISWFRGEDSGDQNLWRGRNDIFHVPILPLADFLRNAGKITILGSDGNWMVEALSHHRYPVERAPYNMLGTDLGTEISGLDFGYPTVFYSAGDKSALTENGKVSTIIPFHTAYDKPHADNEILPLQDK